MISSERIFGMLYLYMIYLMGLVVAQFLGGGLLLVHTLMIGIAITLFMLIKKENKEQ